MRLETCIQNNLAAIKDNDLTSALTFNHAFHFSLTEIADMPVLAGLLDGLWMRTGPLIARAYGSFNERMAIDHHWDVLEALKKRDGAGARNAICSDILDGSQKMLEYVQLEHD
ncbi:HTH-type transcriptional regulator McbR [compost metagenome]